MLVGFVFVCALLAISPSTTSQTVPPSEPAFLATSSADHLWLLSRDPKGSTEQPFQLRYHNVSMGGPYLAGMRHLSNWPDFLLAVGDRMYVIWQRTDAAMGHEVASLRVLHNPSFNAYYAMPQDRFETNASLPAGWLIALADHADGPVALLLPSGDIKDAVAEPTLLQLQNAEWVNWPLPAEFDADRPTMLSSDLDAGRRLILLQTNKADPETTDVFTATDNKGWSRAEIALNLNSVRSVRRATGRAVIVQNTTGQSDCRLGFLRPSEVLWFASFQPAAEAWQVVGLRSGLQLLRKQAASTATLTPIDSITGALGEAQELRPHKSQGGRIWFIALVMAGALGVTLLVMLIRPSKEATPPKGLVPLPAMQRLASLAIDVFPAAVVTLLVTRCSIAELLQAPLITPKLIMSWQYIMLVVLTLLHTTISEMAKGTTLGKAMLGARVITYTGEKPTMKQVLIRALGKLMTFMVLPAAAIALFSRIAQGLDDLLAHTIVVHEPEQPTSSDPDPQ